MNIIFDVLLSRHAADMFRHDVDSQAVTSEGAPPATPPRRLMHFSPNALTIRHELLYRFPPCRFSFTRDGGKVSIGERIET